MLTVNAPLAFAQEKILESLPASDLDGRVAITRSSVERAFGALRGHRKPLARSKTFPDLPELDQWQPPAKTEVLASVNFFAVNRIELIAAAEDHIAHGCRSERVDHLLVSMLVYAEVAATLAVFHKQAFGIWSWLIRSPSAGASIAAQLAHLVWVAVKWGALVTIAVLAWAEAPVLSLLLGGAAASHQLSELKLRHQRVRLANMMLNVYAYASATRPDWHAIRAAMIAATNQGALLDGVVHGLVARNAVGLAN
jgi:hypothetical protein